MRCNNSNHPTIILMKILSVRQLKDIIKINLKQILYKLKYFTVFLDRNLYLKAQKLKFLEIAILAILQTKITII